MNITREQAQRVVNVLGGHEYIADRYGRTAKVYYMTNPNHPAINALYRRFKAAEGVPVSFPLSDTQRTQFELSLLNKESIQEIMKMVTAEERKSEQANTQHI